MRIGTRSSPLALAQALETRSLLMKAHGLEEDRFEIIKKTSAGDRIQDKALRDFGGKGLFTKEIEEALTDDEIDLAVHSMKDVATLLPDGLVIPALLKREDVRDAFMSFKAQKLMDLPQGAVVGTSSLRRQAQVRRLRPDIKVINYRGNVQTRLKKLDEGVADATLLANAGLLRLGYEDKITSLIETDEMLPAVAQGAIGLQIREDDTQMVALVAPLNHQATFDCVMMERVFLRHLDGNCHTPIAGLARLIDGEISFRGMVLSPDGAQAHETSRVGPLQDAQEMSLDAADALLEIAGTGFLTTS
ncbi:MAG: hydroxymethylbilane synthase [bacterium]|nr:hydroxymethylbilane synthase [bacterium]